MSMSDVTSQPLNPYDTKLIDSANEYAARILEQDRLAELEAMTPVDPSKPETGPSGFHVELPESTPAVSGLIGQIREYRINRAKRVAVDAVKDVDISFLTVHNERKIPRSGWPGTFKPQVGVKNPDGSPKQDSEGNKVMETNIYRPSKFHHRRKSMHAGRLVILRANHGMRRNGILRSYGVDGPANKIGIIESVGVLDGRDGEVKRVGMVADVESGARARDPNVPRSRTEKRHFNRMDLRADRDKKFMNWYDWRLDRMEESPHARARAERAAKRANRLNTKQETAANEQEVKKLSHEIRRGRGQLPRQKVTRATKFTGRTAGKAGKYVARSSWHAGRDGSKAVFRGAKKVGRASKDKIVE